MPTPTHMYICVCVSVCIHGWRYLGIGCGLIPKGVPEASATSFVAAVPRTEGKARTTSARCDRDD